MHRNPAQQAGLEGVTCQTRPRPCKVQRARCGVGWPQQARPPLLPCRSSIPWLPLFHAGKPPSPIRPVCHSTPAQGHPPPHFTHKQHTNLLAPTTLTICRPAAPPEPPGGGSRAARPRCTLARRPPRAARPPAHTCRLPPASRGAGLFMGACLRCCPLGAGMRRGRTASRCGDELQRAGHEDATPNR